MLRELTVLPFWMAFNQATKHRFRVNLDPASGPVTDLTRLGHTTFLPGARYCPSCILEDFTTYGEPYIHRHHQLPVVGVCVKHGAALRFSCPACGVTVMPFNRSLLRPPALRCLCGQYLAGLPAQPLKHQQALLRLSQFASDTLAYDEAPWTREQVFAVLLERSDLLLASFSRGARRIVEDAYGPADQSRSPSSAVVSWSSSDSTLRLALGYGGGSLRAPEFCALLVATGLTFSSFREAVGQVRITVEPARAPTSPRPTIKRARQEFARLESESPGLAAQKLCERSLTMYWLLRLRDSSLMPAHGYDNFHPIPTIKADRDKVDAILRRGVRNAKWLPSVIRASIRDAAWLTARMPEEPVRNHHRRRKTQSTHHDRAVALSRAVFTALRMQARPARLHAGSLSKFVQISMHQAQHAIAITPALQALIAAVNSGKDRRLAYWAARELVAEGRQPSAHDVLVHAGLNSTSANRMLCDAAIADATEGLTRQRNS